MHRSLRLDYITNLKVFFIALILIGAANGAIRAGEELEGSSENCPVQRMDNLRLQSLIQGLSLIHI